MGRKRQILKEIKSLVKEYKKIKEVHYDMDTAISAAKELLSSNIGKKYISLVKKRENAIADMMGVSKRDPNYTELKSALDKAVADEKAYRIKYIISHPLLINEPGKPAKTLQNVVYDQASGNRGDFFNFKNLK